MVIALGPGKFYGSGLPRPRFYTDVKFSDERVDPPAPVLDSLMSWAEEAHWSMGGLNVKRLRFQGRIEGNISKIKAEHERSVKKNKSREDEDLSVGLSPEVPPAPFVVKRKRRFLIDEEESDEDGVKCGAVRKLGDDFEKVAEECGMKEAEKVKVKSKKMNIKGKSKKNAEVGIRVSPRLAKRG